jgi:hypothetical protein
MNFSYGTMKFTDANGFVAHRDRDCFNNVRAEPGG